MSLPTLIKTYQFATAAAASTVNQSFTASGTLLTDAKAYIYAIVNSLVNMATNPAQVVGSSNGTGSYSMSGTNYLTSATAAVWAGVGTNHTWIVLKFPQITGTPQILIDLNSSAGYIMTLTYSASAGFTGGSATTAPTATDGQVIQNGTEWIATASTNAQIHVTSSTDGQVFDVWLFEANQLWFRLHISQAQNPITGWNNPNVCFALVNQGTTVSAQNSAMYSVANVKTVMNGSGGSGSATPVSMYCTAESFSSGTLYTVYTYPNDVDGGYPMQAIGLASITSGNRGRHGQLFDKYFGSTICNFGDTYPGTGSKLWAQFDQVVPWNGTTPLVS